MKLVLVVLALCVSSVAASAQSSTTGAIQGVVSDRSTGEKLAGVTVTATSPSLLGAQTSITDENGFYKLAELPPGDYLVTFYYLELTVERRGVIVGVNKTTPVFQKIPQPTGEPTPAPPLPRGPADELTVQPPLPLAVEDEYTKTIPAPHNEYVVRGVNASGESISTTRSYRSVSKGWMIVHGQEVGAEMRLLTAPSFGGMDLALTDVAILTLRGRVALGKRVELFGSADVLPKQPSTTDELVWQSATLGVNTQPWDRGVAMFARASTGTLLGHGGYWGQASTGVTARKALHRIMLFEGKASALATQLRPDNTDRAVLVGNLRDENAWLVEGAIGGNVLFHDPHGWTGGWVGFDYSLPVANGGAPLDPQPRLDLEIGAVLSFVKNWDVFTRIAVIDRGDAHSPATQLPILDGGFDQRQIIVGVTYHSADRDD